MINILETLKHKYLLCDGAMGTMLQAKGLSAGECPEYWNITRSKDVSDIHKQYINAGSDIVLTNTFGGCRLKLSKFGLDDKTKEINVAAVKNARSAAGKEVYVAGDMGPTGSLIEPLGFLKAEEVYNTYKEQAMALEEGGADLLIIESMIAIEEAKEAAKREAQIQAKLAQEQIAQQVNHAKEELRKQVAKLAISGAEKILMREVDAKANSALLDNLIEEI